MRKDYNMKIRRGQSIYSSRLRRFSPVSIILTVVAVVALFATGWFLYTPVYNLITGQHETQTTEPPTQEDPQSPKTPTTDATDEITPEPKKPVTEPESSEGLKTVYLPNSAVYNESLLSSKLDALDKSSVNAVMVDLKDYDGTVLFNTENESVVNAQIVSKTPMDIKNTADTIKEKGFTPVARLSSFKDGLAKLVNYEMAVKYNNTDITWLDKAPEYGGASWINPYSTLGREYICGFIAEAGKAGFEVIILDTVQFPNGYSMETATYPESSGKTKQQALSEFVQLATKTAKENGAEVYVYIEAPKALGMDTQIYGGNPIDFVGENIAIGVMPSLLGERLQSETLNITNPSTTPYETVLSLLKASHLGGKNVIAMLQAYTTATPATSANYKPYARAEIEQQIKASEEFGVKGYIEYSPDGEYK